jgi:DNA-3-methyladenine glycosylase I
MTPSTPIRCAWPTTELGIAYHDREWGVPVHDDRLLFEFLVLEGAQAGLSWETILKKRTAYRQAFDNFEPAVVGDMARGRSRSFWPTPGSCGTG